jgi:hypothetical protein
VIQEYADYAGFFSPCRRKNEAARVLKQVFCRRGHQEIFMLMKNAEMEIPIDRQLIST